MPRFDKEQMSAHIMIAATPQPELLEINPETGKFRVVPLKLYDWAALEKQLQEVRKLFAELPATAPGYDSAEYAVSMTYDFRDSTATLGYVPFAFAGIEIRSAINTKPGEPYEDHSVKVADAIEASLPYWAAAFPKMDFAEITGSIMILGKKHIPA
jgi:hypothetical protein